MPTGMILAAGRGSRLGYLTSHLPKPLLPVANLPVMTQGINSLRRIGVSVICVNVSYRAQEILDAFRGFSTEHARISWSLEPVPVGTAGGVKRNYDRFAPGEEIVIVSGDAMLDVDLNPLLRAHREHGALITLATIPVADPSVYGVVVTNDEHRITQFQEKPVPGTEISHQANTGIYIMEREALEFIPDGEFVDFAMHVFPEVLRRGLPFYAFPVEGYWTDIGNPGEYLRANMDFLANTIKVHGSGEMVGGSFIGENAEVSPSQCERCVIGANVRIHHACELSECVVWPNTVVTEGMRLNSAVLTPWGIYRIDGRHAYPLIHASTRL